MPGIIIRPATAEDAAALNTHRRAIADEPGNNVLYHAGEYTRTVDQECQRIQTAIDDPRQYILLAFDGDVLVGHCAAKGIPLSAGHHCVGMGIDLAPSHRGQGLGSMMMTLMLTWAHEHPEIRRVELEVFTTNRRAISLYMKHGFIIEGCKHGVYIKDGKLMDTYIMGLLLD